MRMTTARGVCRAGAVVVIGLAGGAPAPALAQESKVLVIRAVEGLRYDPPRLQWAPGTTVRLRFENADTTAQPHNLVIGRPGSREALLAAALALGTEAPAREFVPASDAVLAASRLLAAGEHQDIAVDLPEEPGVYPMICTFPGHGLIMYGALYSGVAMPRRVQDDPHIPKPPPPSVIAADPRPMVRRIFLPGSGPAAIAVALPGRLNLCWDAGVCRLRYIWQGEFLAADKHFEGKGQALAQPGGPIVFTAPEVFPLRLGGREPSRVAFLGYALKEGLPTFEYSVDDQLVKESFYGADGKLVRRFQFASPESPVAIQVGSPPAGITITASSGSIEEGILHLKPGEARDLTIHYVIPLSPDPPDPPDPPEQPSSEGGG